VQPAPTARRRRVPLRSDQRRNPAHLCDRNGRASLLLGAQQQRPTGQRVGRRRGGAVTPRGSLRSEPVVRSIAILLPVFLGACFSYAALGGATPARGSDVVARLSVPLQVPLQD